MTERIRKLCELTLNGKTYAYPTKTEFDRHDIFLPKEERESKRICEYIMNQRPVLTPFSSMTGFFIFDGSVVGDAFKRGGHEETQKVFADFYLKPVDNISTLEWQHATAAYGKLLCSGIEGILKDIDDSLEKHTDKEQQNFLLALRKIALTLIDWAHKCAKEAEDFAQTIDDEKYKENLLNLSKALMKVPEKKPESFYEAVLCIYICFCADPDSVGTLDRYLEPFYRKGIADGSLDDEKAKEILQELFLMLQSATHKEARQFTRGGESHFCIGGYGPDGNEVFSDFSKLILTSLIELPTYIPQVTFRWTGKTSKEDLRFVMDCERKDPHGRIAFTNDEKRIKCYTEICNIPYERAVTYTTVGCNEPAFMGAITGSNSKINLLYSIEDLFFNNASFVKNAKNFEEFYAIFEKGLFSLLERCYNYDDKYNSIRAKDTNYISNLFFYDCIENAKSLTQGGGNTVIASPMMIGITNVIDSLIVIKQFVYDENIFSLSDIICALENNWEGFLDMRTLITKKGDFFGNDTERSNFVARKLYDSFYHYLKDKTNIFGYHFLVGDLLGYNEHHKWFGEKTKASPDGRSNGDMMKFGLGQSEGRDREGLTALLNSIATVDPNAIACGSTVTNISIDEVLVKNDANFEKTVDMFETYFKNGGVHFQLTYVSKEDLIAAKKAPANYGNLRVRVSGFSDYFVKLHESIQDDVIERTAHSS